MINKDQIYNTFHPSAPITKEEFLVGRQNEIRNILELHSRKATYPIIVGKRAIGKTSLLTVVSKKLGGNSQVTCTQNTTFDHIAKKVLNDVGYDITVSESVVKTGKEVKGIWKILGIGEIDAQVNGEKEKTFIEIGQREVDEQLLFRLLIQKKEKILITIDEYDRITDKNTKTRMADFIKMISDNEKGHKISLIFAGVGQSKEALIGSHASINRQTREVFLNPLTRKDFIDYIVKAENKLNVMYSDNIKKEISIISLGQPYYLHLLCLEAINCLLERDPKGKIISFSDYEKGKINAVRTAYNEELEQYKSQLFRIRKNDNANKALQILCEQSKPVNPINNLVSYSEKTQQLTKDELLEGIKFIEREKLIYTIENNKNKLIGFTDPLLKPFIRLRYQYRPKKVSYSNSSKYREQSLFDYNNEIDKE